VSAKQGGDLGWISKGMTEAAFEQKLFAMNKPGEISDVVETNFGYHIIQLEEIKSAKVEPFETKKAQLVKAAQQQEIDNLFYERSEQLATLVYENDQTLLPAADALGLKIQNTGLFSRSGGVGIAANESIRKAVFSEVVLKESRNSEVIELGKNHILVLRVNEHQPAKAMTLEEVKPFVEMAVKTEKSRQKVMATGLQALADAKAGKSLEVIAREQGGELVKLGAVQRKREGTDNRIVQAAFRMNKPVSAQISYDTVETQNGIALVAVASVSSKSDASRPEELQAAASLLEGDLAEQEMVAVLNYLKSQSDIVIGKDQL
jgi:peptidyl-prolyl cis-trans isomerase D